MGQRAALAAHTDAGLDRLFLINTVAPIRVIRDLVPMLADPPLHTSSFRALGGTANTFANECFMDELSAAAGADPVAFRLPSRWAVGRCLPCQEG